MFDERTEAQGMVSHDQLFQETPPTLSTLALSNQIKLITDTLSEFHHKLQYLKDAASSLSPSEIKTQLYSLPDLQNISQQITSIIVSQTAENQPTKLIYEIPTELQIVDQIDDQPLYEYPVQMAPFESENKIYEVPLEMFVELNEETVAEYLSEFSTVDGLPEKIKNILDSFNSNIKHIYQIPVDMNFEEIERVNSATQTEQAGLENLDNLEIENKSSEEDWNEVDDTLTRMKKMIMNFSAENLKNQSNIQNSRHEQSLQLTGNIAQDLKLLNQDHNSYPEGCFSRSQNINQIEPLFLGKQAQSAESEGQTNYKITVSQIQQKNSSPQKIPSNLLSRNQSPELKGIHLSSSIQSVFYGVKNQQTNIQQVRTPVSNETEVGWNHHPELDFCGSSQMEEKTHNSFANSNSLMVQKQKQSLNFKESCIQKKIQYPRKLDSSSIVETLNFRNPIYVIPSESSSQGSRTDRQMYVSQMEEKENMKFNMHENKMRLSEMTIEISEFQHLKQKVFTLEEEKKQLSDQLKQSLRDIKTLNEEVVVQREALSYLQNENKEEFSEKKMVQKQMQKLETSTRRKEEAIDNLEDENIHLKKQISQLNRKLQNQTKQLNKLNQNFETIEKELFIEIDKLTNELEEKENYIQQIQKQSQQNNLYHKGQVSELLKMNDELRSYIDELSREIEVKKSKIEELKYDHDKLMREMESAQVNDFKSIYSKEYQKMKEDFHTEMERKQEQVKGLQYENQRIKQELSQKICSIQYTGKALEEHQRVIDDLREELEIYQNESKNPTITMAPHIEAELYYLRRQLVLLTNQTTMKDLKVKQLELELQRRQQKKDLTIDFEDENGEIDEESQYVKDLKKIIREYEAIIKSHHNLIEDLQQHVYEYLKDAMEKEQQSEVLYDNLLNYENQINSLLYEKVAQEQENRKLKRMIKVSETKISAIGNKLLYVAKDKLQQNTEKEGKMMKSLKSQNSTVKMGVESNLIH